MVQKFLNCAVSSFSMVRNSILNMIDAPVIVLLYHRVTNLSFDPQKLAVTPANFRCQMSYLKSNYPVLRIEDDIREVKEPSVVITFDDGYEDNVINALPILEELEVPATFFVASGYVNSNLEYWWDDLERIIVHAPIVPEFFEYKGKRGYKKCKTVTFAERHVLYQEILLIMKSADEFQREKWFSRLREWANIGQEGRKSHQSVTLDQLRQLSNSKWATVGAHTVTHTSLHALSYERQVKEITDSKRQLQTWTGKEITSFSYPFGGKGDYTNDTPQICKRAGFSKAASNFPGQVHGWTDPFQLPRHLVRNWSLEEFRIKLTRFFVQ